MKRLATTMAVLSVALLGLLPWGASAATPAAPAWTIEAVPFPSAFQANTVDGVPFKNGPGYLIEAYNVGGEQASGTFTVTDTLPKGLLPAPAFPATGGYGRGGNTPLIQMSCSAVGRKVTCTGGTEGSVEPGGTVNVVVPVKVEAGATGTLVNSVAIEGGGAAKVEAKTPTPVSAEPSPFGFIDGPGLYGSATNADGSAATQAASHPYQLTVAGMNLTVNPSGGKVRGAGGGLREATVELPAGIVVNPQAATRCKESELETPGAGCPASSQVGIVALTLSVGEDLGQGVAKRALYNMVPPAGVPAAFGLEVVTGSYVHLLGGVRSDGSFTLTASGKDVLARVPVLGVRTSLWGEPSAESHDRQRAECLVNQNKSDCSVPRTGQAFVTLPSACGGPLKTGARIGDWIDPGAFVESSYLSSDREGNPVGVSGCAAPDFTPTIEARPTTAQGESPSGLDFELRQPQHEGFEELATASLKNTTVALPVGLALNPSAAGGRDACSAAQIGLVTAVGQMPIRYREEPAHCPDASKLGTFTADTPLLDHRLQGAVYLAKPFDNPFGSLLGIYLVLEDEATGIIAKLAGRVEADAATGQLRTTVQESPQFPLSEVALHLYGGARGALITPIACGAHTTDATLTPWSTPEGADAHSSDSFQISGSCASSEAAAPKDYGFAAGAASPLSGAYSPFVLKLTRADGTQRLSGLDVDLPAGLTGKLAGIPYCPEAGIARAQARSNPEDGKLEQADPSCPAASEVGRATVAAGSGPSPFYVTGHAYLAGPYKGAPLSMVVITPAVAGPFDLGVVEVRVAVYVDAETARIHAVSDPLPTILDGIPLDVRSIALSLDRPNFTLNPTSCEAKSVTAQVTTQVGQSASVANRFQVGECGRLKFKPKMKLTLKGATRRTGHPALKAVVTYPNKGAYANIARAQVALPHSEFLDQGNIGKACTKPVLLAKACPKKSIYGKAKAWTPLFEKPLEGPVYLVGGYGYKLPALVAELDGQVRVLLVGKVDTGKSKGIRNTFEAVPDAPVSRFVLQMKGGKKYGLLENSEELCAREQRANARFVAQNGRVAQLRPRISVQCGKKKGKKHQGSKGHGRSKGKKGRGRR
jgi:hypothetical protein